MNHAVEIDHVTFCYESAHEPVLKDVSLSIKRGSCALLCGRSGCGKTTLAKLVNGLIPHAEEGALEGRVLVCGMDAARVPLYSVAEKVATVFQNPKSQFFNVDPPSEITFSLENRGLEEAFVRERLNETVKALGIEKLMDRSMFALSGGEKQLIAFASAYAAQAEVVVLDEPSANLDARATAAIARMIALMKSQGTTIIVAEHRLSYLRDLVDEAFYLENGQITRCFTAPELLALTSDELAAMGLRELTAQDGAGNTSRHAPRHSADSATSDLVLSVEGLSCSHAGRTIFDRVSMRLSSGEVCAITGRNGVGKSTLLRCLCGLQKYDTGRISLNGELLYARKRRRASYLVMQDVNRQLFGNTALEECLMGNDSATEEAARDTLWALGLRGSEEAYPLSLSGGQKQRLAVASAKLAGKRLLFFDEPTSGLDLKSMEDVVSTLAALASAGAIVAVVTHDAEFIRTACTRCIMLEKSRATELHPSRFKLL